MIADRAPGTIWMMHPVGGGYVRTAPDDRIEIVAGDGEGRITLSRKDARLLAKRINQCLDATRTPYRITGGRDE